MDPVPVDIEARIDTDKLEKHLEKHLQNQQVVYAVMAVMEATEEGVVDPLEKILDLRDKYQAKGLSFCIHADAAWGGYFSTMIPKHGPMDGSPRSSCVAKL
jgi:glutamate/tyrosine decarboxylase-like PLP-dependent enzyme